MLRYIFFLSSFLYFVRFMETVNWKKIKAKKIKGKNKNLTFNTILDFSRRLHFPWLLLCLYFSSFSTAVLSFITQTLNNIIIIFLLLLLLLLYLSSFYFIWLFHRVFLSFHLIYECVYAFIFYFLNTHCYGK